MAQYIATANPTIQAGQRYASDCTNKEWTIIAPDLAQTPGPGRKRTVNLRQVVNAIFYRVRTGCQWRMLPQEFPDWRPVWYYYKKWTADGAWERLNDVLRRKLRQPAGKEPDPSLDILWTAKALKRPKLAVNAVMMGLSTSRAVNVTFWSIRWAC
jgi:putative transposase